MTTSARNTIYGTIASIQEGAVNSEVILSLGEEKLVIILTNESIKSMGCKVGEEAYALIKSSSIILTKEKPERISARNVLKMKVDEVKVGAINVEINMSTSKNTITAQITKESTDKLDVKSGDEIYVIIKASHIILGMV
jgi:molybdate transport system regulatory protein